jgi:TatD DNase family protein
MAHDAHCHPYDASFKSLRTEAERVELNIACAASSWYDEDFNFNKALSRSAPDTAPMALTFGVHPQLTASKNDSRENIAKKIDASLRLLEMLCAEQGIAAIGECGYDLFTDELKAKENIQEEIFQTHLDLAIKYNLPIVLHLRKAMHKVFENTAKLKKIPAVIFHSYSGSLPDAISILHHDIRGYFSFGNIICKNHKNAIETCMELPIEYILTESDIPYQPLAGKEFSSYRDLRTVIKKASLLKDIDEKEFETVTDKTFFNIFFPNRQL